MPLRHYLLLGRPPGGKFQGAGYRARDGGHSQSEFAQLRAQLPVLSAIVVIGWRWPLWLRRTPARAADRGPVVVEERAAADRQSV
jgi:hypothetical protein